MSTTTDAPRTVTNSELGRHLLTMRGFHFVFGAQGDPYALLLRAGADDPAELGSRVRDRGTLYRSEAGAWVTGHHALAREILRDRRLSPRHEGDESAQRHMFQDIWDNPKLCHIVPLDDAFLNLPSTDYERFGDLCKPVLGATTRHRAAVEGIAEQVVSGLPAEFDLVTDFARPVAVAATAGLLGLPEDTRRRFADVVGGLGVALDAGLCPPQYKTARKLLTSVANARELLDVPGLFGDLRPAADPADVLAAAMLLTVVGIEVAANLTCNTVAALLANPDQWQALRADTGLAAGAVEESLRFDPPIRLENRIATTDIELAGHQIPADAQLVVAVGAANRDPAVFPDPDRFDITRKSEVEHLTLSGGLYDGFVAPLVRAQAEAATRVLASSFPALRQRDGVLRRMRSPVVRGVLRFPVAAR
ncbi:P450-derived glycosyltransferase activator [Parafrankia sp. FMc6]|uniref:cytochrome P450 family protein n=1 Tax=Parafrankia soli TaxID=2599596 RepID=UPI0034D4D25F